MELEPESGSGAETLIARFMSEGESLFKEGEYEEALSRWLKVLEIDPANELAMLNMARAHEMLMGSPFKKVVSRPEEVEPPPPPSPRPVAPAREVPAAVAPPRPAPVRQAATSTPAPADATRKLANPGEVAKRAESKTDPIPRQEVDAATSLPDLPSLKDSGELPSLDGRGRDSDRILRKGEGDEKLDTHLKRYLKRGVDHYNSKDYEKAVGEWAKVLRERPRHEATLQYIRRARGKLAAGLSPDRQREEAEAFERLVKHGQEYFAEGEYRMAINQFVQGLTFRPDDRTVLDRVREAEEALNREGESRSVAPGTPRVLRHGESPMTSGQSGAFARPPAARPPAAPGGPEESDKLRNAAQSIYTQILKEQTDPTAAARKPTGVRTQSGPVADAGPKHFWVKIFILVAGVAFLGWNLVTYLRPSTENFDRAMIMIDAARWPEALDELSQHIQLYPDDARGYRERARVYGATKDFPRAAEDLKKVLELQPDDPMNVVAYAHASLDAGDYEKAAKAYKIVIDKPLPDDVREKVLDNLITAYINTGDLESAVSVTDALYEKRPDPELLKIKGDLLMGMNRFADGRAALEKVIESGGLDAAATNVIAMKLYRSYLIEGDLAGAEASIDKFVPASIDVALPTFLRAKLAYRRGDLEGALKLLDEGLKVDVAAWRGYAELAIIWALEWQKSHDPAVAKRVTAAFDASRENARIDGRLSFVEGVCLALLGERRGDLKLEEAIRHLEPAMLDDLGFSYLAMAQLARKDYAGAEVTLGRAIQGDPNSIAHHVLLAYANLESSDPTSAAKAFLRSLEVQPGDQKVLLPVESMFISREDADTKVRVAALKLDKDSAIKLQNLLDQTRRK